MFNCILLICVIPVLTLGIACNNEQNRIIGNGFLEGKVSIGPLCPVEMFPPDPACQPTEETYKNWPIAVWTTDQKTKLVQIQPKLDGTYIIELPEGMFLVDLEVQHMFDKNLPATVNIKPGETAMLNIEINTGIR